MEDFNDLYHQQQFRNNSIGTSVFADSGVGRVEGKGESWTDFTKFTTTTPPSLSFSLSSPTSTPLSLLSMNSTSNFSLSLPYNGSYDENFTSAEAANDSVDGGIFFNEDELPMELRQMSESSKHCVIAYCILFVIATSGNLTVLLSVFKQYKKTKSRISLLILHLSIADLIVCCTLIPTEVFWRLTIQWYGGNALCKICQFLRAFGLYLSSMVLICVSFDRFFAILFPMKMLKRAGQQKIKIMLWIAWITSAAFSTPQAILFSIASHPQFPSFKQCVTNEFLKNTGDVRLYSIFSVSAMYFAPLVVILFTYTAILIKIVRKAHQGQGHTPMQSEDQQHPQQLRNRLSVKFRMSVRNHSASSPLNDSSPHVSHIEDTFSEKGRTSLTPNNLSLTPRQPHHHHVFQHNHLPSPHYNKFLSTATAKLLPTDEKPSVERRKKLDSSSSLQPGSTEPELSSEEGSCSGSTCSQRNCSLSSANNSKSKNNQGVTGNNALNRGGSLLLHRNHHNRQLSSASPSPDPSSGTLGRVGSRRSSTLVLRRSDNAVSTMSRAKNRTLVMTIVIVVVFVLCWTPYVVMTLWYMFDWEGAKEVNPRVQDGLFVMAVANSCVNPLIYGSFAKNCCGLSNILARLRRSRGTSGQ